MTRLPLAVPAGVYRNGTEYQAKGRFYDSWLIRWRDNTLQPVGGWQARGVATLSGMARAVINWRDNAGDIWAIIGTHSNLYVTTQGGDVYDITPVGFEAGAADAVNGGGFGGGTFGSGTFGTPRTSSASTGIVDATQWTLDTFGQNPVGVSPDDGKIYEWDLTTTDPATQPSGSPSCDALVVTPERFLFALGAGDPRTVAWPDQESLTDWTPSSTNQAGSFPLQTGGKLMCGKAVKGETLIFTDIDVWRATYTGDILVYGFDRVGDACGAVSRQCAVSFDMQAAWMSRSGFWVYNGYVNPIPCEVWDYIALDINWDQRSKIIGTRLSEFNEIEWRYCSSSSIEIDRCVVWNWVTGVWSVGRANRTAGCDKGAFQYPMYVDSSGQSGAAGTIYDHEKANIYDGVMPWAEAGPVEIGNGDSVIYVTGMYPDDATLGDVTATFYAKTNPDGTSSTFGPYTLSQQTDLRFCGGRELKVRYDGANMNSWRVGQPLLDITMGGQRS